MRRCTVFLVSTFLFVMGGAAFAQESSHATDSELLARLSYERSPFQPEGIQRICLSVRNDGNFRILSLTDAMKEPIRLTGKMADDQLLRLKKMLAARELQSLSSNDADIIRGHAEQFVAEISMIEFPPAFKLLDEPTGHPQTPAGPPRRVKWLNADHQSPFPTPIAKLIDWMERFKARNSEAFDYAEFADICPSVGLSLVQPSVAENTPR